MIIKTATVMKTVMMNESGCDEDSGDEHNDDEDNGDPSRATRFVANGETEDEKAEDAYWARYAAVHGKLGL